MVRSTKPGVAAILGRPTGWWRGGVGAALLIGRVLAPGPAWTVPGATGCGVLRTGVATMLLLTCGAWAAAGALRTAAGTVPAGAGVLAAWVPMLRRCSSGSCCQASQRAWRSVAGTWRTSPKCSRAALRCAGVIFAHSAMRERSRSCCSAGSFG